MHDIASSLNDNVSDLVGSPTIIAATS